MRTHYTHLPGIYRTFYRFPRTRCTPGCDSLTCHRTTTTFTCPTLPRTHLCPFHGSVPTTRLPPFTCLRTRNAVCVFGLRCAHLPAPPHRAFGPHTRYTRCTHARTAAARTFFTFAPYPTHPTLRCVAVRFAFAGLPFKFALPPPHTHARYLPPQLLRYPLPWLLPVRLPLIYLPLFTRPYAPTPPRIYRHPGQRYRTFAP